MVTIASAREAYPINAAASLAVMVRPVDGAEELAALLTDRRINAVVLGPGAGIGAQTREQTLVVLSGERGVVLDADALTSFADSPKELISALRNRTEQPAILTPHEGEFTRLFKDFRGNSSSSSET